MLSSLTGLSHILASSLLAASFAAPMQWSPNGQWLAYTIIDSETSALPEGWLLSRDAKASTNAVSPTDASGPAGREPGKHRIWVTRHGSSESVLIEESRWPLSSPTWQPDGRSLIYGRFTPDDPDAASPSSIHGRYEIVVRSALDQKRVLLVQPDLELTPEQLAAISMLKPAVSSDSRYLAVPRPGKTPGFWVLRLDQDRVVKTVDSAQYPAWAPDGLRLIFLKEAASPTGGASRSLSILNHDMGVERPLTTDVTLLDAPPLWSLDGQAILAVANPPRGQMRQAQVDLVRISLDTGFSVRMMTLEMVALANDRRRRQVPALAPVDERPVAIQAELSLDHEQDQAICLIEVEGQEQAVKWCNVRTLNTFKRFHPLDLSLRIGAPAVSPDGRTMAFRVQGRENLGLPAFCDLSSETVTLIAPDASTRDQWLVGLASCASDLIDGWLQPAAGGEPLARATILPIPGELIGNNLRQMRLRRLSKFAKSLLDQPIAQDPTMGSMRELRLFFDYIRGDYRSAGSRLDELEAASQSPDERLRWLCLRAQILLGQGEFERARGIIEYIGRASRMETQRVEDTPLGPVLTSLPNPANDWSKHLAQKLTEFAQRRLRDPLRAADDPETLEPTPGVWEALDGVPQLPFAPDDPGHEGLDPDRLGAPPTPLPRLRFGPGGQIPVPPEAEQEPDIQIMPDLQTLPQDE